MSKAQHKSNGNSSAPSPTTAAAAAPRPISMVTATVCRMYLNAIPEAETGKDIAHIMLRKSAINKNIKALRPHCADGEVLDTLDKIVGAGPKYFVPQPSGSDVVGLSDEGELLGEKWLPMIHRAPGSELGNEEMMRVLQRTALISSSSVPAAQASATHHNKVYPSLDTLRDDCQWRRFPGSIDGKEQDKIYVSKADALNVPKNQQVFDRIPPAQLLVTRALRFRRISELGLGLRVSHCNEFTLGGSCDRGADCFFVHAITVQGPGGWKKTEVAPAASSPTAAAGGGDAGGKKKQQQQEKKQQQQQQQSRDGSLNSEDFNQQRSNSSSMMSGQAASHGSVSSIGGTPLNLPTPNNKANKQQQQQHQMPKVQSRSSVGESSTTNTSAPPTPIPSPVSAQQSNNSNKAAAAAAGGGKEKDKSVTFLEIIVLRCCQREVHEGEVRIAQLNNNDVAVLRNHPLFAEQASRFPSWGHIAQRLEADGLVQCAGELIIPTTEAVLKIKKIYKRLGLKLAEVSADPCSMTVFIGMLTAGMPQSPPLSQPQSRQQNDNRHYDADDNQHQYQQQQHQHQHHDDEPLLKLREGSDHLIFNTHSSSSGPSSGASVDSSLLAFTVSSSAPHPPMTLQNDQIHALQQSAQAQQQQLQQRDATAMADSRASQLQMQLLEERKEYDDEQRRQAVDNERSTIEIMRLRSENSDLKQMLEQQRREMMEMAETVDNLKRQAQLKDNLIFSKLQQAQQLLGSCEAVLENH